jgi:phosphoglycerate dehydrogenase-like enzyme
MVIIGFGDIGAACGKIIKAFGTKVIGLKRRPDQVTEEDRACADEILGMD